MSELEKFPFPDPYVHKLIIPAPHAGNLNELILCWKIEGAPPPDRIRHTKFVTNINDTTCPFCWRLWTAGVYG